MNVKAEIEIKDEKLDLKCNSYEQEIQIFPDSGTDFASPYNIKSEKLDEASTVKSELKERRKESMSDEEQANNDVLKCGMLPYDADEVEKGSKMKSISYSRPQTSGTRDENIRNCYLENLCCTFCNVTVKNKDEFENHLKTHNKGKFNCAHCSYESNRKKQLKVHMVKHGNAKLLKCSECTYECNHRQSLKIHILNHRNVKLFKCSECGYECNQKGNLKTHILTHGMAKLLKCSECNYECNRKGQLKTHMLEHGNIKLFKCSDCTYKCNRKGDLNRHVLTHGNVKLFKCSECNYECNRKGILKSHLLSKHGTT